MDEVIAFVYHHIGKLVTKNDDEVVHEMGGITEQPNQEVDTLDVFAIRNFHKDIGYDQIEECYWLVPGRPLSIGLMVLDTDAEMKEMCFYAERNRRKIHIYYEHGVSVPNPVEECPYLIEFPPSPMPVQAETPTPIVVDDVDFDSEADQPPNVNANSPSKTKSIPPNNIHNPKHNPRQMLSSSSPSAQETQPKADQNTWSDLVSDCALHAMLLSSSPSAQEKNPHNLCLKSAINTFFT
ncbi:hypothetical protein PIB30_028995 [Stylosanthes scabra]|uniref:PB1-like domain-containing protein n=1 Tax=Stylosanthes scabra TaxID=79078 RepID=A0ABU6WBF2_9FABA|nr:hypothetical protein [Stylosanthes scabra]